MDPRVPSPLAHVEHASPLDTLVRRASSRRTRNADTTRPAAQLRVPETPPRRAGNQQEWQQSPHSPLLHTQFRSSVASTSISAYEQPSYTTDGDSSALWDSTQHRDHLRHLQPSSAPGTREVSMASQYSFDDITSNYGEDWQNNSHPGRRSDVPSVRVSAVAEPPQPSPSGRTRSQLPPGHANFSRPVPPPLPPEEQKRQVLMRNANSSHSSLVRTDAPRPPPAQQPGRSSPSAPHPPAMALPRPNSQNSVYSSYSYYPYDAALPSPSPSQNATHSNTHLSPMPAPAIAIHPPSPSQARDAPPSPAGGSLTNPQTAQDFLQLGIQHHLANELSESAACFEKSATLGGGCGMGMLMWGLTQRHGWGCPQSEARGFKWLRRAAELAVNDLESAKAGMDSMDKSAVKSELVLAIYEVGQSFFRGWGVDKDKKMAVSYFRLAADLGDPDAQQDLAFCLANGKGCKKDRKEAAKWYRAAVAQGVSDIGLAWIYKEKFQ